MARVVALLLALLLACAAPAVFARKSASRRLDGTSGPYPSGPSSGSSPVSIPPVTASPPVSSSPSPVVIPPVTSSPPAIIPPVTSSPTGYGGYGSRSGKGSSGFWSKNSGRLSKVLSLVSTIAKIFGGRAFKKFGGKLSLLGAVQNTSPEAYSSLAREGTASLFNAYSYNDFPLSTGDVINNFDNALDTPESAAQQAIQFQQMNDAM